MTAREAVEAAIATGIDPAVAEVLRVLVDRIEAQADLLLKHDDEIRRLRSRTVGLARVG